jgi:uridine kinase
MLRSKKFNLAELELLLEQLTDIREEVNNYRDMVHSNWEEWESLIKKVDKDVKQAEAQSYKDFKKTHDIGDILSDAANRLIRT